MGVAISVRDARLDEPAEVERLFEILDAYARGPGGQNAPLTLEVHASNAGARRLYARFGFEGWDPATYFVSKPL